MGVIQWLYLFVHCGALASGCSWFRDKDLVPLATIVDLVRLHEGEAAACYDHIDCSRCACVTKCSVTMIGLHFVFTSSYEHDADGVHA